MSDIEIERLKLELVSAKAATEIPNERIRILQKMLRYIAYVLTGDETADVQLAADQAKQKLEDAAAETERLTAELVTSQQTRNAHVEALTAMKDRAEAAESALAAAQERIKTLERQIDALPANWNLDSSLETWFPFTAEEFKRTKAVCDDIRSIMAQYREQEATGSVDTPGGLEHMGDVWSLLSKWAALAEPGGKVNVP